MLTTLPSPTHSTHYHWSFESQRAFLEELSICGNVEKAAKSVSMNKHSAYRLRHRRAGITFKIGWEAAILIARGRLEDTLMERALDGVEEVMTRSSDGDTVSRVKQDNRLGMSMLIRLDNRCEPKDDDQLSGHDAAMARIVSQDFEAFLDLIEGGGTGAAAAMFVAAHCNVEDVFGHRHLSQNSDDSDHETVADAKPVPQAEEQAAEMSIWYCQYDDALRTDFPPPKDFDGYEDGTFGEDGYERGLSEAEEEAQQAMNARDVAPLRAAGERARLAYFGTYLEEDAAEIIALNRSEAERSAMPVFAKSVSDAPSGGIVLPVIAEAEAETEASGPISDEHENTENVSTHNTLYWQPQPRYLIPPWGERIC